MSEIVFEVGAVKLPRNFSVTGRMRALRLTFPQSFLSACLLFGVFFGLAITGCKPKQPSALPIKQQVFRGQIFITLASRETIKMSLVKIQFLEANAAQEHFDKLVANAATNSAHLLDMMETITEQVSSGKEMEKDLERKCAKIREEIAELEKRMESATNYLKEARRFNDSRKLSPREQAELNSNTRQTFANLPKYRRETDTNWATLTVTRNQLFGVKPEMDRLLAQKAEILQKLETIRLPNYLNSEPWPGVGAIKSG